MADTATPTLDPSAPVVAFALDAGRSARIAAALGQETLDFAADTGMSGACSDGNHGGCAAETCTCDCHTTGMGTETEPLAAEAPIASPTFTGDVVTAAAVEPCACGGTCEHCATGDTMTATGATSDTLTECGCATFSAMTDDHTCSTCNMPLSPTRVDALAVLGIGPSPVEQLAEVEQAVSDAVDAVFAPIDPNNPGKFRAILMTEEEATPDGRIVSKGATSWRQPPLTLMWQPATADGHDGAVPVGRIDKITRKGAQIVGEGVFDNGTNGLEYARLVRDQVETGISIDGGDVEGDIEVIIGDDGNEQLQFRATKIVILAATGCATPAIGSAQIEYVTAAANEGRFIAMGSITYLDPDAPSEIETVEGTLESITAAGPRAYDQTLFMNPEFGHLTPLRVVSTSDPDVWHVEGHLAPWDVCHIGFAGMCKTAPRSKTNYSHFLLKSLCTIDGSQVQVGTLTLDTDHANGSLNSGDAKHHYDHTGTAAAWVNAGEDAHGIWVSGVLCPGLSEDRATMLSGASLSGDWRKIGGHLELVAALAVNVPGFPVTHVQDGAPTALVAAGYGPAVHERRSILAHVTAVEDQTREQLSALRDDLAAMRERHDRFQSLAMPLVEEALRARLGIDDDTLTLDVTGVAETVAAEIEPEVDILDEIAAATA